MFKKDIWNENFSTMSESQWQKILFLFLTSTHYQCCALQSETKIWLNIDKHNVKQAEWQSKCGKMQPNTFSEHSEYSKKHEKQIWVTVLVSLWKFLASFLGIQEKLNLGQCISLNSFKANCQQLHHLELQRTVTSHRALQASLLDQHGRSVCRLRGSSGLLHPLRFVAREPRRKAVQPKKVRWTQIKK